MSFLWKTFSGNEDSPPPAITASQSADTAVSSCGSNDRIISLPHQKTPSTPEGLRPRASPFFLRRQLGFCSERQQQQRLNPAWSQSTLPPSSALLAQTLVASPVDSTYENYLQSTNEERLHYVGQAESPQLLPGQAKTAVGALVALEGPQKRASTASNQGTQHSLKQQASQSWVENPKLEESLEEIQEPRYYSLGNDHMHSSRTPVRASHHVPLGSPISLSSSLHGSPSSRVAFYVPPGNPHVGPLNTTNTSFSSQIGLISTNPDFEHSRRYDFAPLMPPENARENFALSENNQSNISAMSCSAANESEPRSGSCDNQSNGFSDKYYVLQNPKKGSGEYMANDSIEEKEELLVAAVRMLRGDLQLLRDLESFNMNGGSKGEAFLSSALGKEGIITGYSENSRKSVVTRLSTVQQEILTAKNEVFSNPTDALESHSGFLSGLKFCIVLVQNAVPIQSPNSCLGSLWKASADARAMLGIIPPETPRNESGGDTSRFSLPDECVDTPMTSNVSLTTTLPSMATTPKHSHNQNDAAISIDGLVLRRTIEVLCTLLQQLTFICSQIAPIHDNENENWSINGKDSKKDIDALRTIYQQLLSLDSSYLQAMIDLFKGDQDSSGVNPVRFSLPPPPGLQHSTTTGNNTVQSFSQLSLSRGEVLASRSNLFSPTTLDMNSPIQRDTPEEDEAFMYDDLRRTVGSADYDDEPENRDAPEGCRE